MNEQGLIPVIQNNPTAYRDARAASGRTSSYFCISIGAALRSSPLSAEIPSNAIRAATARL